MVNRIGCRFIMIDSSLKELLENISKINELSKKAINDLSQFLEKNDSDVSNKDEIINDLLLSILPLTEKTVVLKNLQNRLLTKNAKGSSSIDVPSDQEDTVDPKENAVIEKGNTDPLDVDSTVTAIIEKRNTDPLDIDSTETAIIEKGNTDTIDVDSTETAIIKQRNADPIDVDSRETVITEKGDTDPTCMETKTEVKPMLKLVDFDKLVDPKNLQLMNEKSAANASVIVLSSSEDEALLTKKSQEKERVELGLKKNHQENEKIVLGTKKNLEKEKLEIGTEKNQGKEKVELGSSSEKQVELETTGSKKVKSDDRESTILSKLKNNIHKDIKFRSKPYVRLSKLPSEEMEDLYSRKNMGSSDSSDDIRSKKKTTDSASDRDKKKKECTEISKNRNRKNGTESSSDTGTGPVKAKRKTVSKNKMNVDSTDNSDSSDVESTKSLRRKKEPHKHKSEHKSKSNNGMKKFDSSNEESDQENTDECDNSNINNDNMMSEDEIASNSDGNSSGDSETFLNCKKVQSKNSNEDKDKESMKLSTDGEDVDSDNQKTTNSKKEIIISSNNSDDSDFDTFFKKNRFVNSTKIDSSDSEDGSKKIERMVQRDKEKESTPSENTSDKEEKDDRKRKRKRIKEIESNSSDSDDNTTRRKIKKLISKDSLSEKTKKAAAEEKERKQRILDKQKKYNQIYESANLANSKVEKLVLDIDEETEQPLLEVDKALVSKLKPHQASGIQFMWDACFESLKRIKKSKGSGCILAHCMGLGKTLQVIALADTLLEGEEKTGVKKILIVTPLSTVLNWKAEFKNWLSGEESYEVYELASVKPQNAERAMYMKKWNNGGGVLIISYAMFRNLSNDKNKKVSKKFRTIFIEGLVDPGPDLVVCDEGHLLKNEKTSLSVAMNKIQTRRRIVLTGTPLQNNLKEYYCMVQFVKPNLLGTYREYLNRFVNPITNGQYTDSTQYDINLMRRRSHVLHKLLDGIVQRRDYSILAPYLPPKFEYVLFLTLTEAQKKLYEHYMEHLARKSKDEGSNRTSFLFTDFQALSRICIHPRVLLDKSNDDQQKYQSDEESIGSLKDFIDDNDGSSTSSSGSSSGSESDSNTKKKKRVTKRVTRAQKNNPNIESESEVEEVEAEKEWWQQYCDGEELDNIAHSTKILLLFEILKECEQIGDKVLVFSQSLYALNLIEYFLEKVDEATQNGNADEKTCGFTGSWALGLDYFRLDGSTNCGLRSEWCDSFNKESNSRARLFLLSTRAGGLGINLVAANRVIIFDVSWNPSSDIQSIFRVYRFGQLKPSYIYRFVIYGTMEMKIYERQVTKQAISKRVIDEQQIDRHYNQNDLAELYKYEVPDLDVRPTPLVPKDVLLGELLRNQEDKIYKYHEHQTLLENKEDEILNEEERKAAWDEFENEKVERVKQTLIGKFSVSTVQIALKNIIQKDNPTWNNSQILSIIPQLIQQLNLQLSVGDQTMYNRIAAEIKLMQDEYARKMQMQLYQYRMQVAQTQHLQNLLQQQQQFQAMRNRFPAPSGSNLNPNTSNNLNPNEIVELN